jgi:DinB superfamily
MEPNERREILALLEQGRAALVAAVDGVTDGRASRIPAPGRWSILGCVEHIAFSEDYMFAQIAKATPSEAPMINLEREAKMLARGADRSRKIESPPEGQPTGAYATLATALDHFLDSRSRTVEFVRSNQEDLRTKVTWHPILKQANCHEMLLSMGLHVLRHVKQIEEIKGELA